MQSDVLAGGRRLSGLVKGVGTGYVSRTRASHSRHRGAPQDARYVNCVSDKTVNGVSAGNDRRSCTELCHGLDCWLGHPAGVRGSILIVRAAGAPVATSADHIGPGVCRAD